MAETETASCGNLLKWDSQKRSPSHERAGARGFTLIELLVVISVIGLLTAIAIPAYVSYRQRAVDDHMIRDLENARIAMESYYADKNEYTSAVADLVAVGFRQTPGVALTITLTSQNSYTMTASKPNGTKPSFSFDSNTGVIQ